MTADRAVADVRQAIEAARKNIDAINTPDAALTFENSVRALEHADDALDTAWLYLNHLESVATSPELRKAVNELLPDVSNFSSSVVLDEALYAKILVFSRSAAAQKSRRRGTDSHARNPA